MSEPSTLNSQRSAPLGVPLDAGPELVAAAHHLKLSVEFLLAGRRQGTWPDWRTGDCRARDKVRSLHAALERSRKIIEELAHSAGGAG